MGCAGRCSGVRCAAVRYAGGAAVCGAAAAMWPHPSPSFAAPHTPPHAHHTPQALYTHSTLCRCFSARRSSSPFLLLQRSSSSSFPPLRQQASTHSRHSAAQPCVSHSPQPHLPSSLTPSTPHRSESPPHPPPQRSDPAHPLLLSVSAGHAASGGLGDARLLRSPPPPPCRDLRCCWPLATPCPNPAPLPSSRPLDCHLLPPCTHVQPRVLPLSSSRLLPLPLCSADVACVVHTTSGHRCAPLCRLPARLCFRLLSARG